MEKIMIKFVVNWGFNMQENMITYKIYKNVYDEMASGKKNVEIRLLNEKSQKIKIGDKITFQVVDSDLSLIVEVTNKYIYSNVDELWEEKAIVSNNTLNYTQEEFASALYEIFGKDKVVSSKIVGIEFKILKK